MGRYEKLIKEDLSCMIVSVSEKNKDREKNEKDKFRHTIEILSNPPCEVYYSNTEKSGQERNALKKVRPLTNPTFFEIPPLRPIV